MRILITGVAGFIGYSIAQKLLSKKYKIIGIDNINNYYSKKLKVERLKNLKKYKNFIFYKKDCSSKNFLNFFIKDKRISLIIHLAAEVGVRNSYSSPGVYYKNNIESFFNILEICRNQKSNLIFASSSSVYGSSKKKFFKESHDTSSPISFYAATKKSNEVMAHAYAKNYNFTAVGIRFFNVYGPWGRPDMSIYKFTSQITKKMPITIFGNGKQIRDFTYIDDAILMIEKIIKKFNKKNKFYFDIFNSGKGDCIKLNNLVNLLSKKIKINPKILNKKKQLGDVNFTNSSSEKILKILNFSPKVNLSDGMDNFLEWYYKIGKKIK